MIPDNILKLFDRLARSAADEGFEVRLEARDYSSKTFGTLANSEDNSLVLTIYHPEDSGEEAE